MRFFATRLGSRALAEDLAQDLYLKVVAMDEAEPMHSPSALLFRMGSNLMLDRLRSERRNAVRDDAWNRASRTSIGGEDVVDEPPADEALASRQRLAQLSLALEDLPPRMRRAFQLHKLEGLSHLETARAMGISVSAVEKHISGALKALLAKLG